MLASDVLQMVAAPDAYGYQALLVRSSGCSPQECVPDSIGRETNTWKRLADAIASMVVAPDAYGYQALFVLDSDHVLTEYVPNSLGRETSTWQKLATDASSISVDSDGRLQVVYTPIGQKWISL